MYTFTYDPSIALDANRRFPELRLYEPLSQITNMVYDASGGIATYPYSGGHAKPAGTTPDTEGPAPSARTPRGPLASYDDSGHVVNMTYDSGAGTILSEDGSSPMPRRDSREFPW